MLCVKRLWQSPRFCVQISPSGFPALQQSLSLKSLFYKQRKPLEMRNLLKSDVLNNVLLGLESSYRCHQLQCCRWVWQPVKAISCRATGPVIFAVDSPNSSSPSSLCSGIRVAAVDQHLPWPGFCCLMVSGFFAAVKFKWVWYTLGKSDKS